MPQSRPGLVRRHRDFRLFWIGQSISVVGTQVTAVALPLVAALNLHAGAGAVSAIATASYLPNVVLPLLAGAWLETRRKRPAMVCADLVRALALAAVPIAWALTALSVPLLVVVALVVGSASVLFDVGSFAYLPTLVETDDLAAANRAMQGSATAAQVAGPGLAGLAVQAVGAPLAIVLDAISYLGSALGIRAARQAEAETERPDGRVGVFSGLSWIWANVILRSLVVHASVYNAASQIFTVNLIVYAVRHQGLSAGLYGLALSAGGLGALFGTLTALRLMKRLGYGRSFALSLVLSTGAPILVALLPGSGTRFAVELAGVLLLSGCGLGSANVLSVTLRQVVTPISFLARTNGGYRLLIFGAIPIGSVVGGIIGSSLGSRTGVAVGAIGLFVSAAPMFQRRIRNLKNAADARDDAAVPTTVSA